VSRARAVARSIDIVSRINPKKWSSKKKEKDEKQVIPNQHIIAEIR